MICTRCTQRLARLSFRQTSTRSYSTPVTAQTTTSTVARPEGNPAATSRPEHAQPFSTPLSPSPNNQDLPIKPSQTKTAAPRIPSSAPAGTVLKGLNFIKGKQDPVALEDHEYPDWLWNVLEKKPDAAGMGAAKGEEGDLFSKSKKQRQRAAKAQRKRALQNPESLAPKVPLYEQSIDLPSGDGTLQGAKEAGEARQGLTKAMRDQRRSKIKEANFLKAMG